MATKQTKYKLVQPDLFTQRVSELEVIYKNNVPVADRTIIKTSKDAARLLYYHYDHRTIGLREEFMILYLNRRNACIGLHKLSVGGITGVVVDIKILLGTALKICASAVILCHNHPSGMVSPSEQDKNLTTRVGKCCELLQLKLVDSIILSPESEHDYFSFADEGLL